MQLNLIKRKIFLYIFIGSKEGRECFMQDKYTSQDQQSNQFLKKFLVILKALVFILRRTGKDLYYGMRALLIFYMYFAIKDGGLGMWIKALQSVMAVYGALIYMTSVLGGWFQIGYRHT